MREGAQTGGSGGSSRAASGRHLGICSKFQQYLKIISLFCRLHGRMTHLKSTNDTDSKDNNSLSAAPSRFLRVCWNVAINLRGITDSNYNGVEILLRESMQ